MQIRQTEPKDIQSDKAPRSHGIDAAGEAAFSQSQNYDLSDPRDKRRFWEHHLEQCRQSPLTQKAYCKKHGLKIHQFYYWKRRSALDHGKVAFLPVDLFKNHPPNPSSCSVRILIPNGVTIELDDQASLPDLLVMVSRL